jgi:hypothetical protein
MQFLDYAKQPLKASNIRSAFDLDTGHLC